MWGLFRLYLHRWHIAKENRRFVRRLRMLQKENPTIDYTNEREMIALLDQIHDCVPHTVIEVLPITGALRIIGETFQRDVFTFHLTRRVSSYINGHADNATHHLVQDLLKQPNPRIAVYAQLQLDGDIQPHQRTFYLAGERGTAFHVWLNSGP